MHYFTWLLTERGDLSSYGLPVNVMLVFSNPSINTATRPRTWQDIMELWAPSTTYTVPSHMLWHSSCLHRKHFKLRSEWTVFFSFFLDDRCVHLVDYTVIKSIGQEAIVPCCLLRLTGSQCHREITLTAPTMNVQYMDIQYVIRVFYMEVKLQTFMVIGQWRGTIFSFQEGRKRVSVWVSSMHMNWVMSHQNMFVMYNI